MALSTVLHWANISWDQHSELTRESEQTGRRLVYLFITIRLSSARIEYWQVDGSAFHEELKQRSKDHAGSVWGLHVAQRGNAHFVGSTNVTRAFSRVELDSKLVDELRNALGQDLQNRTERTPKATEPPREDTKTSLVKSYSIPLTGGREAKLEVPFPVIEQDVTRLKGWLELMGDVLSGA